MSAERSLRRLARDRTGATAAVFALVLPIFIAMVIGLFQFGWTQHCASSLRFALEQAGRSLMLNPSLTQAQLKTMVQSKLAVGADPNVTVELDIYGTGPNRTAVLTGGYTRSFGLPGMAVIPVNYSTAVTTPLP